MSHWILVRSQPNREDWAVENIRRQGHDGYVPKYRDVVTNRIRALFPSYVFADTGGAWYFLKGTFGVSCPIIVNGVPQKVPISVIEGLKHKECGGLVPIEQKTYSLGDRVRILGGAFAGENALYQGQSTQQRVKVLLSVLGVLTPTHIDRRLIEAVA